MFVSIITSLWSCQMWTQCNTWVEVLVPVNAAVFVSITASLTAPNTNIRLIHMKRAYGTEQIGTHTLVISRTSRMQSENNYSVCVRLMNSVFVCLSLGLSRCQTACFFASLFDLLAIFAGEEPILKYPASVDHCDNNNKKAFQPLGTGSMYTECPP